jgi:SAM-dependent methyltransferase
MLPAAKAFAYESRPKEYIRECLLCGGSEYHPLTTVDRYGFMARVVYCEGCGLSFVNPRLVRDELQELYRNHYRPLVTQWSASRSPNGIPKITEHEGKLNYAGALGMHFSKELEVYRGTKAVDIGGSTGEVAAMLKENFDISCKIIEPNPSEVEYAKKEYGVDGIITSAEDWDPGDEKFDLLFCCQSVEHLMDPLAVLQKMRAAANGLLFLDIVDFAPMFAQIGRDCCKIDHCYNFVHDTICSLLAKAGFRVWKHRQMTAKPAKMYVCIPDDPNPDARPGPAALHHLIYQVYKCQASYKTSAWNELPTSFRSLSPSPSSKQTPESTPAENKA